MYYIVRLLSAIVLALIFSVQANAGCENEEMTWQRVQSENTVESYSAYIDGCDPAIYIKEAVDALNSLGVDTHPKTRTYLRQKLTEEYLRKYALALRNSNRINEAIDVENKASKYNQFRNSAEPLELGFKLSIALRKYAAFLHENDRYSEEAQVNVLVKEYKRIELKNQLGRWETRIYKNQKWIGHILLIFLPISLAVVLFTIRRKSLLMWWGTFLSFFILISVAALLVWWSSNIDTHLILEIVFSFAIIPISLVGVLCHLPITRKFPWIIIVGVWPIYYFGMYVGEYIFLIYFGHLMG